MLRDLCFSVSISENDDDDGDDDDGDDDEDAENDGDDDVFESILVCFETISFLVLIPYVVCFNTFLRLF